MICPACGGNGFIRIPGLPDPLEPSQNPYAIEKEITCPTCEGQGELADGANVKHCPACGEPLEPDQNWCSEHRAAEQVTLPTYPALCVICSGKGYNEVQEYSYAKLRFETKQIPCADCEAEGYNQT